MPSTKKKSKKPVGGRPVSPAPPATPERRPLLHLVMMVKNEAKSIEKTIASCLPLVDGITILDTGSTDGTQALAARAAGATPCRIFEEPFVDYGATRNRLLELAVLPGVHLPNADGATVTAKHCDAYRHPPHWLLMMSGDESLVGQLENIRTVIESDVVAQPDPDAPGAYYLQLQFGPALLDQARLIRVGGGFRYMGSYHEALCHPQAHLPGPRVPGVHVFHDAARRDPTEQWKRGIGLLQKELAALPVNHPHRPRVLFYLAQTYECLGDIDLARQGYALRAQVSSWPEEDYEAQCRLGRLTLAQGFSGETEAQGIYELLTAWAMRPIRSEPFFTIADYFHHKGAVSGDARDHARAAIFAAMALLFPMPKDELLAIDPGIYSWKAHDHLAVNGYYLSGPLHELGRRSADVAYAERPWDERLKANVEHFTRVAAERGQMGRAPNPGGDLAVLMDGLLYVGDLSKNDARLLANVAIDATRILEFGAGASTQVFAQMAPKSAEIVSVETSEEWIERTQINLAELGLPGRVTFRKLHWWPEDGPIWRTGAYDLVFVDGVDEHRAAFADHAWTVLTPGGSILFHDTRRAGDRSLAMTFAAKVSAEVESVHVNVCDSNITLIRKASPKPYVNWNAAEKRLPWESGAQIPPHDWPRLLREKRAGKP